MRIVNEFEYARASSLKEALSILARRGKAAAPLAGGTDLVVNMKYRSMLQLAGGAKPPPDRFEATKRFPAIQHPEVVVSLRDIEELHGITTGSDRVAVGPLTTMAEIAANEELPPALGALRDAAGIMGSPIIRNRATFGGNVINARPAADSAVSLLALGGRLELASTSGRRWVNAEDFFTGPGTSVRRAEELLVTLEMPCGPGQGSAYLRQGTRRQLEIALVGAAAWVEIAPGSGEISAARIALGAVAPTPVTAPRAAQALVGKPPDADNLSEAARTAREEAKPIDDFRGSAAYRLEVAEVLVQRALTNAVSRAGGKEGQP